MTFLVIGTTIITLAGGYTLNKYLKISVQRAFFKACKDGDSAEVQRICDKHAIDVNARLGKKSYTPLDIVVHNIHATQQSKSSHKEVFYFLLSKDAELHALKSTYYKYVEREKLHLAFFDACQGDNEQEVRDMLRSKPININFIVGSWSALHRVAFHNSPKATRILLVDPNIDINLNISCMGTALHIACDRGNIDIVHLLLNYNKNNKKVNVNIRSLILEDRPLDLVYKAMTKLMSRNRYNDYKAVWKAMRVKGAMSTYDTQDYSIQRPAWRKFSGDNSED